MSETRILKTIQYCRQLMRKNKIAVAGGTIFLLFLCLWIISYDVEERYENLLSAVVYDRNEAPLSIAENKKGHYAFELRDLPNSFSKLLVQKEDRFFYFHPGINPVSSLRALYNHLVHKKAGGSSTLTQQLAKNLLSNETERTIQNKLIEMLYALSIELFYTKGETLHMYANSVFLGNQVQGFGTASYAYFDKPFAETTHNEQITLLATLSHPSTRNPWEEENTIYAESLNEKITPEEIFVAPPVTTRYSFQSDSYFELRTSGVSCVSTCKTAVDGELTEAIRSILARHIDNGWSRNIRNGAVVVIDPKSSELIAIVGSKNPKSNAHGNQINMAIAPRPIGSTVKPFIYAKGFMEGLRPYTLVEDREYKYPIATGFSLYPKNYDGQYRGEVTLHTALSNSLNVPSVKVLEYIGLDNFYAFLHDQLQFQPIQPYDSYQYGIALGGLEMDLLTLTHYFSLFPQKGYISPLKVFLDDTENYDLPPQSNITEKTKVVSEDAVALVHTIISDRFTGVNQFGLESNLNLTTNEYGVKTGTSRDFHDSWVIGYTNDFVVGVWLGNSENTPLTQVSGQSGAGGVWHDVMEYLLASPYNYDSPFSYTSLDRYHINNSDEWGLVGDTISNHRNLLTENNMILSIHPGDTFELTDSTVIPLKARTSVLWNINGEDYKQAKETSFAPTKSGFYEVSVYDEYGTRMETVTITLTEQPQ